VSRQIQELDQSTSNKQISCEESERNKKAFELRQEEVYEEPLKKPPFENVQQKTPKFEEVKISDDDVEGDKPVIEQ